MSIWKDLLFLGGHVATPAALDALRDAPDDATPPAAPVAPPDRPRVRRVEANPVAAPALQVPR